jgi:hypothetical protein
MSTITVEMSAGVWAECNGEDVDIINVPDDVILTEKDSYKKRPGDYRYILTGEDDAGNEYEVTVAPDWKLADYEHENWCDEFIKAARPAAKGKPLMYKTPRKRVVVGGKFKPGDRVFYECYGYAKRYPGTIEAGPFRDNSGGLCYTVRMEPGYLPPPKKRFLCGPHTLLHAR